MMILGLGVALSDAPCKPTAIPTSHLERRKLAWKIVNGGPMTSDAMKLLAALGEDAIPAATAKYFQRDGENADFLDRFVMVDRYEEFSFLIQRIVFRQTAYATMDRRFREGSPKDRLTWTQRRHDPAYLQRVFLFAYLKEENAATKRAFLYSMLPTSQPEIVDRLFDLLKKSNDGGLRLAIAQCGRPDVIRWLREHRPGGRKCSVPSLNLPPGDADHDGIPNQVDANPFTAPRHLSEEERLVQSAFAFYSIPTQTLSVTYPSGCKPFELLGSDSQFIPDIRLSPRQRAAKGRGRTYKYPRLYLSFGPPSSETKGNGMGRLEKGALEAYVDITRNFGNGFGGTTIRIQMRKFGNDWLPIGEMRLWVS